MKQRKPTRAFLAPRRDDKEHEQEAALAYARACNTLDVSPLGPFLDASTVYDSQSVIQPLIGADAILHYLRGKFATLKASGDTHRVYAELGLLGANRPCVVIAQGHPDELECVVLFKVEGRRIKRVDLCTCAPHPIQATRTGEYPK